MTTDSNCQAFQGSVLVDSGSDEHVCRKGFALSPDPHPVALRDVQKFFNNAEFGTYLFRLVHLEITEAQCAFKVADVNDDVLRRGRLLRRGFEFDLSMGRGCCMSPRGKPEKAVPLCLHNNSLRLEALPLVRAISDCRPVGMDMESSSSTVPEVRAPSRDDEMKYMMEWIFLQCQLMLLVRNLHSTCRIGEADLWEQVYLLEKIAKSSRNTCGS